MEQKFEHVFFHPWIGSNFESGINNKKILILGESHICGGCKGECGDLKIDEDRCREFTALSVEPFLKYKQGKGEHAHWMNTYTRFSNVFNNKQLSGDEMLDFWNSICFYNYVQIATDKSRISPTSFNFRDSEKAFFEVLEKMQPDLVIAWGARLWDNMPSGGEYKNNGTTSINYGKGLYYYKTNNKQIPTLYIPHPSSLAFGYGWYGTIQEALLAIQ